MLASRDQIQPVEPDRIPQVLKDAVQWALWKAESNPKKPGVLDKVPYRAKAPGRKASSTDPATWADYETAYEAYVRRGETCADGLLFACGDGFGGVDIDGCIDPQTGEIAASAQEVIRAIDSYTEKSVSGTGIRIFVRTPPLKGIKDRVEIYTTARFYTVTGQHIAETPLTVEERGEQLAALRQQIEQERASAKAGKRKPRATGPRDLPPAAPPAGVSALGITDDEVLAACQKFSGFTALWNGSIEGCKGQSEADMKLAGMLAFACGPDEHERVERLMRRSGLVRDKWDRDDYLPALTIPNAYAGRTEFFIWPSRDPDAPLPCDARPTIVMGPETDAILQQLETHLSPYLFQHYGRLVSVAAADASPADGDVRRPCGALVVSDVPQEQVHRLMSRHVVFEQRKSTLRQGKKQVVARQVSAPANLAKLFTNCGRWSAIPSLAGITTTPFLRRDGGVVDAPGYDPKTGFLFVGDGTEWLVTPSRPTPAQIQAAVDVLNDIVCDFPFGTDEHRSAWIATLSAAVSRPAINGPVPMLWIDSPRAGTGKTKLARAIGHVATGLEPTEISFTSDEKELENRLASLLLEGDRFAFFDNATGSVRNPVLDRFLTSTHFGVRRYFTQQIVKLRNTTTLAVTGNNLVLRGDLSRRVLRVRLVTDMERPETRSGFRHPDLEGYVAGRRPQIVNAILTILRAHAVNGFPEPAGVAPLGSFPEWERVIRHALVSAGLPDPVATQEEVHEDDDDQARLLAVLQAWWRFRPRLAGTATHIVTVAMDGGDFHCPPEQTEFREALRELTGTPVDRPPCGKTLGYRLRDARDKKIAGYRVVKCDAKDRAGVQWRLEYDGSDVAPAEAPHPSTSNVDAADAPECIAAKAYGRPSLLRRDPD